MANPMKSCSSAIIRLLSMTLTNRRQRQEFQRACRLGLRSLRFSDSEMMATQEMVMSTAALHERSFGEFKGCNAGKDVVVLATGPSISRFVPIQNAVYIGVNNAFRDSRVELDYLFAQDYSVLGASMREMNDYRKNACVKFYGLAGEWNDGPMDMLIPEPLAIAAHARRYRTIWWPSDQAGALNERFAYDLCSQALASYQSIVFPALQFALWTNPRRIYLVGCDCSGKAHNQSSASTDTGFDFSTLIRPYLRLRDFAKRYYPKTEFVSVNPVGLKGVFRDMRQE